MVCYFIIVDNKLSGNISLYVCEKEDVDGIDRFLDISVTANPENYDKIRGEIKVSKNELRGVLDEGLEKTFKRFGITDLESHAGIPKGPYHHIDKTSLKAKLD